MLGRDQAAASRALKALIRDGYVESQDDADDARAKLLVLTNRGDDLRRRLLEQIWRRTEIAMARFSYGERKLREEFVERLMANVDVLEDEPLAEIDLTLITYT